MQLLLKVTNIHMIHSKYIEFVLKNISTLMSMGSMAFQTTFSKQKKDLEFL